MYGPPIAFHFYHHSIVIDEEYCTGCCNCLKACPVKDVIGIKKVDGKPKAYVMSSEDCIGCMKCFRSCLVKAITCKRTPKKPSE